MYFDWVKFWLLNFNEMQLNAHFLFSYWGWLFIFCINLLIQLIFIRLKINRMNNKICIFIPILNENHTILGCEFDMAERAP